MRPQARGNPPPTPHSLWKERPLANISRLLDLQKMDSTWEKIRRRLIQIQKLTSDPENVVQLRAEVEAITKSLHEWQAKQRDAELESRTLSQRIADSEKKLMSGVVRIPKELEALQASVDALHRQLAGVEEAGVEALLEAEQWTETLAAQQKVLDAAEKEWQQRHTELLAEESKLKRYAVQLKGQRAAAVAALPPADVARYDDLRKRKAGVAVSEIANGLCAACGVRLPTGVVSAAKSASDYVPCPSCGRILAAV
jgi:predicted  nucleic acid-binding Zn-ribbon protein